MDPLCGIDVLELGHFITGPYAALQLADLGARVIKVEHPDGGDAFRGFGNRTDGYSHNFCAFNRNKVSVAIDLRNAEGLAILRQLIERVDVLLTNFRPTAISRLGLDYAALKEVNPRLIYCAISGFSADGPYADRPAFDTIGQALSGLLGLTLDPNDPRIVGPTIVDQLTALYAANAITGGIYQRERTGIGMRIDISMIEAAMSYMPDVFAAHSQAGLDVQRETRASYSQSFAFVCADKKMIAVHIGGPEKFWLSFITAIDRPDLLEDARLSDRHARIEHFQYLIDILRPVFAKRPRFEWMERLVARDVACAEVHSVAQALDDPEVRHLRLFDETKISRYGDLPTMRRAVRINGRREGNPLPPPGLGEQTDAVLREIGVSAEDVARLRKMDVIA